MKTELTIHGLNENIAYCEAIGLAKCFEAYAKLDFSIMEGGIGFNTNSGLVYIVLENDVAICSMLGRDVEYLVTDLYTGEEFFFDNMEEAENQVETLNKKFLELTKKL